MCVSLYVQKLNCTKEGNNNKNIDGTNGELNGFANCLHCICVRMCFGNVSQFSIWNNDDDDNNGVCSTFEKQHKNIYKYIKRLTTHIDFRS